MYCMLGMPGGNSQSTAEILVGMINARDQETARVARILHDNVGQVLSAVGLQLGVLRLDYKDALPEMAARVNEIQEVLEQAINQVRDLSYEMNPAIVERAGLQFALERLVGRYRSSFPGALRLMFDSAVHPPVEAGRNLYKIAECALDNAVRHAHASQVEVLVREARKATVLEVRDNGCGFDSETTHDGLGLVFMHHYAREAGLQYTVRSQPGKGTVVKVTCQSTSHDA